MTLAYDTSDGTIMEALNNKADIDLNNLSADNKLALIEENKEIVMSWMIPDYNSGVNINLDEDIIAPYHCFITAESKANANQLAAITLSVKDDNDTYHPIGVSYSNVSGYSSSAVVNGYFSKGQIFKCSKTSGSSYSATMYPLKGAN